MEQEHLEGMPVVLSARNATLDDLARILQEQHAAKFDVVAPAVAVESLNGVIGIRGTDAIVDESGVTSTAGWYRPTVVADEGIADKLGIPLQYLRRLRSERPDMYDANVNGWLHGAESITAESTVDPRSFLMRCFRGQQGEGVLRAVLSQSFKMIDNLDVLTAALDGVRETGMEVQFGGCDLSERRMYVKIIAPEIRALAPTLLKNYRSPYSGAAGIDNPLVFGGLVISNSETGGGAFQIVPRLVIQVCTNGMCITKDALRSVHLGSRMDDGVIKWSDDTQQKNLELVTAQARDAVTTFLDTAYVTSVIERIEEKSAKPIDDPAEMVKTVGKQLRFSDEKIVGVLNHFIKGGDVTAGGLMNAVTSWAQQVEDPDDAYEMEAQAMRVLELV